MQNNVRSNDSNITNQSKWNRHLIPIGELIKHYIYTLYKSSP